ncbi:putative protein ariadne-2 [Cytospora mali]|uniref:RBR-type E3 ubiquitin transferase n=1 Tax=Cytospora mali TaxID=578113 RepID=A0A194W1Y5_CYTMA|nr:putative protein ariadne-2 [Valsa mali]
MQQHVEQITAEALANGFPSSAGDNNETETNNEETRGTDTTDDYKLDHDRDRDHNEAEKDAHAAFITDPTMIESIARAVHEDHNVIAAVQVQDNRTVNRINDSPPHLPYEDDIDKKFIHKLEAQCNIVPEYSSEVDTTPHAESSSTAIQIFLSEQTMAQYLARKVEMETPSRTYCHKPECSKFIPPLAIEHDTATCPRCEAKTCTTCKGVAHIGYDCPYDEAGQQLMALADGEGWKQCFSCNSVVELVYGCIHIKCRCGAEFCYKCGANWDPRTCKCDLFAAEDLLYRFPRAYEHPNEPLAEHLAWEMEIGEFQAVEMMQNEECLHRQWRHRGGPAEL